MLALLYYFDKGSRSTSSPHLVSQSLNSKTTVGFERFSGLTKKTIARRKPSSTLVKFEQTLHHVWVLIWQFFEKQVNVRCSIGINSMPIASHNHNAAKHTIAKNSLQSYFKKLQVLFSRKQYFQQRDLLWHNTEGRWKVIIFLSMLIES